MDVRHLGSWYSVLSAECRPGDGDGKDCVGEISVHWAHSLTNRVHHGAQFMLDVLVYQQPVQLTQGRDHMVTHSKQRVNVPNRYSGRAEGL